MQQHRTIIYGASIALWLGVAMGVMAQTPSSISDQQEQRGRTERQAREREWRQALPEVRGGDSTRRALLVSDTLPDESPCVVIESIRLQGDIARHSPSRSITSTATLGVASGSKVSA